MLLDFQHERNGMSDVRIKDHLRKRGIGTLTLTNETNVYVRIETTKGVELETVQEVMREIGYHPTRSFS